MFHHTGDSLLEFVVPEPSIFVDPQSRLCVPLMLMWLRLRPFFLHRLTVPSVLSSLTNKKWKALLEGAVGFNIGSQKLRQQMLDLLLSCSSELGQYGISLDTDNAITSPPRWNGVIVHLENGFIPPHVVKEAVWELYEINFRADLLTLDRRLVPEPLGDSWEAVRARDNWYDRELRVQQCWSGHVYSPNPSKPGLSSNHSYAVRRPYLEALFNVVQSWPGPHPSNFKLGFPYFTDDTSLAELETSIAHFFARSFLLTFRRPAILPYAM